MASVATKKTATAALLLVGKNTTHVGNKYQLNGRASAATAVAVPNCLAAPTAVAARASFAAAETRPGATVADGNSPDAVDFGASCSASETLPPRP